MQAPRSGRADIGESCFASANIVCQSCADACPVKAIRFEPRRGGPALPHVSISDCTGCGDCVAACPASAIAVTTIGAISRV
ncbi:4Fe-4S dicluster domain-containing protein (plasmid) [Nitrobacteraceae bacterium UC4446_H13]